MKYLFRVQQVRDVNRKRFAMQNIWQDTASGNFINLFSGNHEYMRRPNILKDTFRGTSFQTDRKAFNSNTKW